MDEKNKMNEEEMKEAVELFEMLTPEAQDEIIDLLKFLSSEQ